MSELVQAAQSKSQVGKWHLLSTVSAAALLLSAFSASAALDDTDRPVLWIELGPNLQRLSSFQEPFSPLYLQRQPRPGFEAVTPAEVQRLPRYSFGGDAQLTLAPHGSDWTISAAVKYGRSSGNKHVHQQTTKSRLPKTQVFDAPSSIRMIREIAWGDTKAKNTESHMIVDFMAGKDVGLGTGNAKFGFGVRFAQFTAKASADLREKPDPHVDKIATAFKFKYQYITYFHTYHAVLNNARNFRGVGPAITLDGAAALAKINDTRELTFDWGINAAVLFGRQKVNGNFHTTSRYFHKGDLHALPPPPTSVDKRSTDIARSRSRIVPNLGGFAGFSFRYTNAKVSLGYRADFFLGAMDTGIAAHKSGDRSFHGPFAKASIGLGG